MLSSMLTIIVLGYLGFCLLLYVSQDQLIFHPANALYGQQDTPEALGLSYEDVYLASTGQRKIHSWFIPHAEAKATLLFFHGNAGNISHRLETLRIFHELGLAVFIIDYQGYGLSEGTPSEQHTYDDALSAWQYLTKDKTISPNNIIVFGRSMGGGVASWLATRHQPALVILESPFRSIIKLGNERYPFFPISFLTRTHFDTENRIASIQSPVSIIHSRGDEIISFNHGQTLFELAKEPKMFFEIEGDHNTGFLQSEDSYKAILQTLIEQYLST